MAGQNVEQALEIPAPPACARQHPGPDGLGSVGRPSGKGQPYRGKSAAIYPPALAELKSRDPKVVDAPGMSGSRKILGGHLSERAA